MRRFTRAHPKPLPSPAQLIRPRTARRRGRRDDYASGFGFSLSEFRIRKPRPLPAGTNPGGAAVCKLL
jgi:hypothetical protein